VIANAVAGTFPDGRSAMKLAYSVLEACDLLSIGRTTLYGLIKSGNLQARKVGRRTLIPAKCLEAFLGVDEGREHGRRDRDGSGDLSHG